MRQKAILLGMNNPLSDDPRHALWPLPSGCSGNRLYAMLEEARPGTRMTEYRRGFDRRNLLPGTTWSRAQAAVAGRTFRAEMRGKDRTIIVFGKDVWRALDLPKEQELVVPLHLDGCRWRRLPHPSGRDHWYNADSARGVVGMLLEELIITEDA